MAWIESHQTLKEHPKVYLLMDFLSVSRPSAVGHLHLFWWWCVDYAPEGSLKHNDSTIARAAEWSGEPKLFVESLIKAGFLDRANGGLTVHDWAEFRLHYDLALHKKEVQREQVRERVRKFRSGNAPVTQCNAPTIPNQTIPNLTKPKRTTTKEVVADKGAATTPQGEFVLRFGKTYEAMTKQPFKAGQEDYVIVARLIRDYSYESVVSKAEILGRLCDGQTSWFVKAGWADYTIKTLSKHWNSILENSTKTADVEFAEEMKRQEARDARINDAINR